ncbi:MAG: long-chain fatty acid--CoA ligase [Actinobacteria bacterium]|nr:long-chain fatty acid--CoA ligase [Actinomycetota bacterium]
MSTTHARGEGPVDVAPDQHCTSRLWERAAGDDPRHIVRFPAGEDGGWAGHTWAELGDRVRAVGAGLVAVGVEPGDRVVLLSGTRVEWTVTDLAVLAVGGVTVPLYDTSSVEQCEWVLRDSGARVAIAGTPEQADRLGSARDGGPGPEEVWVLDDGGLDALAERGADRGEEVTGRSAGLGGDDLATVIYTSGTTGRAKGCMLTHRNLVWTARQTQLCISEVFGPGQSTLLFLPLAHVFARIIQFLCLENDTTIGYARSVGRLGEDLRSFQPTFLLSVPRVLEKVFNGARRKAEGPRRRVFDFAVSASRAWGASPAPSRRARVARAVADRLVYARVREGLGGRVRYCISGGAPLSPYLAHFFAAARVQVLEGYGLTETTAPATVDRPGRHRVGSVGPPLPGVEVRIADDGEVLVRGGNVFRGYWGNEAATAEVLDADGWFATGDLGELDDEGALRITGRKKELLVTAGGKNVAPAVLEERLKSHRLVSQAMCVGDGRPYVAALVTLDAEEARAFAAERDLPSSVPELARSGAVDEEIGRAVEQANAAVSRAESIRAFTVLERELEPERDEITPTLKIRRHVVADHFAEQIERLYGA